MEVWSKRFIILFVLIFGIFLCNAQKLDESYFIPEIQVIEPSPRKGSKGNLFSPLECGGFQGSGRSNFIASPNTDVFFKWKTINPDIDGMCRITIQESTSEPFKPVEVKGYTEEGWFMCGRRGNSLEQKEFKTPSYTCDICTLQLQFNTSQGMVSICSDISLLEGEVIDCEGRCQNGGTCYNGVCLCASGFGGKYCEGKGYYEDNSPNIWIILLVILIVIAFFVLSGICLIRFINKSKDNYHKKAASSSDFEKEIFDDTAYDDQKDFQQNSYVDRRKPFKHHKFENEDEYAN
ncbi:unnamed protein product [Moneuplotes crassus]|uniref:EGF-like domain-containing protein n=1 Tax=Euplotes crassus TaxID=5936 RepID=A0AAD1XSK6_EUPCR|nr:unnamed protein product [Moneuplotes crassus]